MAKLATRTEGRRPKAAREGKRGRWGTRLSVALWGYGREMWCSERAVDARSAAAGKRQRAGHGPDRCRSRDGCRSTRLEEGWRWALRPCGLVAGHEPAAQSIGSDE